MPNWCNNHITISGPPDRVAAFVPRVQGTPEAWGDPPPPPQVFCVHALVPIPAAVVAQGLGWTGFDWCNAHWGTKWEAGCATNTLPPTRPLHHLGCDRRLAHHFGLFAHTRTSRIYADSRMACSRFLAVIGGFDCSLSVCGLRRPRPLAAHGPVESLAPHL